MRILIVKLSSLGDLFHSLPTVHALHVGLDATVDWVVQEEYAELVSCFSNVVRVIPFSRNAFFSQLFSLYSDLRLEDYDFVIDLQGLMKSAFVTMLARGKRKIGPSFNRECSRILYPEIAGKFNINRHAVEQNQDVLRYLKQKISSPVFGVQFPKAPNLCYGIHVALLPMSRWPAKNWPQMSFAKLAKILLENHKIRITLLGGPSDVKCCREIKRIVNSPRITNFAGEKNLVELGSYLAAMELLISNDSGPVHMAAAVGTPTLSLFGPTDPARTCPFGVGHRVIRPPFPCTPCYLRNCTRCGNSCMSTIKVSEVAATAFDMLAISGQV